MPTTPSPMPYPHATQIINPHIPMAAYNHLHPPPQQQQQQRALKNPS
ncbi:unnamed protein product, partial [Rotaria socialis]